MTGVSRGAPDTVSVGVAGTSSRTIGVSAWVLVGISAGVGVESVVLAGTGFGVVVIVVSGRETYTIPPTITATTAKRAINGIQYQ
jgi:hypothetical protein